MPDPRTRTGARVLARFREAAPPAVHARSPRLTCSPWPMATNPELPTANPEKTGRRSQVATSQGARRRLQCCHAATLQPAEAVGCCSRYTPRAQSSRLDRWTLDLLLPAGLWAVGPNAQASGNCTLCPVPCALYPVPCPSSLNASGLSEHALMRFRIGAVGIQSPPPEPPDERLIWPFIAR